MKIRLLLLLCFLPVYLLRAQVFWTENFSSNTLPEGWTTEDANPQNGSEGQWEICLPDSSCLPDFMTPFDGSDIENGYAFFNSDRLGQDYPGFHVVRLRSSSIDCSEQSEVFLSFETFISAANFNPARNALLRVILPDTSYTYQPFPTLNQDNENNFSRNPAFISFDISSVAAGEPVVQLEWEWTGKFEFYWAIDQVALSSIDPAQPTGAIWYERFDFGPGDWTLSAINPDTALWQWDPIGSVASGALAPEDLSIDSRTAADGAMVFNADFYTTGGLAENVPPAPGPFYVSELISPIIDLSDVEAAVELVFTQLIRQLSIAPDAPTTSTGNRFASSFSISRDGGETWEDPIDANPELEVSFRINETVRFPLNDLEGEANVRIKFTWAGNFYYWVLDDIAIVERPGFDARLNSNFFAITPNAITPLNQIAVSPFLADVQNVGSEALEEVTLTAQVEEKASGTILFEQEVALGDLPVDFLAENNLFPDRLSPEIFSSTGEYIGRYIVEHNQIDEIPTNDTIEWTFEISDSILAKERGFTRNIAPQSLSYSYGNCFFLPNGGAVKANLVTFGVANASQLQGKSVDLILYEWETGIDDGIVQPNEYFPIGFNSYTFEGNENNQLITLPIDIDEPTGVPLKDSTYYLLVMRYTASDNNRCFMLASSDFNYQATWFASDSINQRRFAGVLDVDNSGTFNTIGFGFDVVPVIRLHLSPVLTHTEEIPTAFDVSLFPNPAQSSVRLQIKAEEMLSIVQIRLIDSNGKVLYEEKANNIRQKELTLAGHDWPSGVYWVQLLTHRGTLTKKLILFH